MWVEGSFSGEPDVLPNSGLCKYLITQLMKMSGTSLNVNLLLKTITQTEFEL